MGDWNGIDEIRGNKWELKERFEKNSCIYKIVMIRIMKKMRLVRNVVFLSN